MAFGDLKTNGAFGQANSSPGTGIPAPAASNANCTVAAGDLVVVNYAEKDSTSNLTGLKFTDNLGNVYQPSRPHTCNISNTGRPYTFHSVVTVAGTLNAVTSSHASTTADVGFCVSVFEGPFNEQATLYYPACGDLNDASAPQLCPATGTLPTANCLVIGAFCQTNGLGTVTASSPFTLATSQSTGTGANTAGGAIVYYKPPDTSSVQPGLATNTSVSVQGAVCSTLVFLQDPGAPAFGACTSRLLNAGLAVTNPTAIVGGAKVSVGDLVIAALNEQSALTATACADNLGNTYTAINAGTDAGTTTLRGFYSYVTVAGYITTINVTATPSNDNWVAFAATYQGPFTSTPLDKNPANTTDAASPFTTNTSGVLTQADELIVLIAGETSSSAVSYAAQIAGNSPLNRDHEATEAAAELSGYLLSGVVSATTDQTYSFTKSANPLTDAVQILATFEKSATNNDWAGIATFAGAGALSETANLGAIAQTTFAGAGNFSATANLAAVAQATFAGAGAFSPNAINDKPASLTAAVTGSFLANGINDKAGVATFAGAGALTVNTVSAQVAQVTFAPAGAFNALATNDKPASLTVAGTGLFSASINLGAAASTTFAGTNSFTAAAINDKAASLTAAVVGSFSATARLANVASVTFAGAGSLFAISVQQRDFAGIITFAPAGLLSVTANLAETATLSLAGAGAFSATANLKATASLSLAGAGAFSANANNDKAARLTAAGTGAFSATANLNAVASLSLAGAGTFRAIANNDKAAALTVAGAGTFSANVINNKAAFLSCAASGSLSLTTTQAAVTNWQGQVTFAGTGAFVATARLIVQARITFAGSGSFFEALTLTSDVTHELALIGNQTAVSRFVPCDVATKASRYVYIGYNQLIRGRPTVSFVSLKGVDSFVVYPASQIGTTDVVTCRGLFPAGTYIKCPLDVTKLQTSAGVWEVSVTTPDTATYLMTPDSKAQRFYMSVED